MPDRTFIEWDKDDLDQLGLLKVDVLALGMLTCIRKSFDLLTALYDEKDWTLTSIPRDDEEVYDMICRADTVGVFQIESRAQMSMLPRLKPRKFYDLVIEVAIVRPGPIQGDMVHPYLRRRDKKDEVHYPSEDLKGVLERTLGVPLFQEQAMKIAMVAAGFSPGEADQLRRAMATFRHTGTIQSFKDKFIDGMVDNGYERRLRRALLPPDRGFWRIWLSREPCRRLRPARLCLLLDQMPASRHLRLRAAQFAAHGLLRARADRPRFP